MPKNQTVSPVNPIYDTGPMAGDAVPNMIASGNVDVNHRPSITNKDGSHSSIFSMTVPVAADGSPVSWPAKGQSPGNIAGYALVPSIANGKFLTPDGKMPDKAHMGNLEDAATNYYAKTRQHLGIFTTPQAADAYATSNHDYGNDGTLRQVFTPSPRVAGATGPNGYPPQLSAPGPVPPGMLTQPSGIGGYINSLLGRSNR